jgi:predicted GIY-YIG superfamily endonuclease
MARDDVETFVYLLHDDNDAPLYVGVTDSPTRRFRQHAKTKPWWPLVARRTLVKFSDRASALLWESALIEALFPQFNRTGEMHRQRLEDLRSGIDIIAARLGMPA